MPTKITATDIVIVENIKKHLHAVYKTPQHLAMRLRIEYEQFEKYLAEQEQIPASLILKISHELSISIYNLYGEKPSMFERYMLLSKVHQHIIDRMVDDLSTMPAGSHSS